MYLYIYINVYRGRVSNPFYFYFLGNRRVLTVYWIISNPTHQDCLRGLLVNYIRDPICLVDSRPQNHIPNTVVCCLCICVLCMGEKAKESTYLVRHYHDLIYHTLCNSCAEELWNLSDITGLFVFFIYFAIPYTSKIQQKKKKKGNPVTHLCSHREINK